MNQSFWGKAAAGQEGANPPAASGQVFLFVKRVFDVCASLVGLAVFGWLIVLLVVVIRIGSPGPGLFVQERVGRERKTFRCCKLRTMYQGTRTGATHETPVSSVTKLGGWLRRLKLDELPQLWNVLVGDMSFVGPRPCLPIQHELIAARQRLGVFRVRPGITGKAQVRGVDMSDPVKLARLDAEYIREASLAGDMLLILRTVAGSGQGDRIKPNS